MSSSLENLEKNVKVMVDSWNGKLSDGMPKIVMDMNYHTAAVFQTYFNEKFIWVYFNDFSYEILDELTQDF